MDSLAEEVVDAIDEISGSHPGRRSAHAKGTLLAGTFTAAPEAAALTSAAHMQGDPVRVTARLSNGGGDPAIPDYAREGRGLAVKFYLRDGSKTDVIGLTLPCFFVRTPEDFLAFTQARMDPEKLMPAFLGAHPEALPAIQASLGSDPPDSYATCLFNSIHSYRWTGPDGTSRWVRYRFEPEAGEASVTRDEARARGRDYLQEDCLARAELAFRMVVVVAEDERRRARPNGCLARGARAHRGRPPRLGGSRDRARARRGHPRVRPDPGDRRDRAVGRRDPQLPGAGLLGVGRPPYG